MQPSFSSTPKPNRRLFGSLLGVFLCAALAACGGGGGSSGSSSGGSAGSFTLGGSVSGLTGSGLVLANGGDTLAVTAGATSFTLPTAVASGSSYNIGVQTQPAGQTCSVASGSGTMGNANVGNVVVTCSTNAFALGGSVSGLSTAGLVLANGSDTLAVTAGATSFTLPTAVASGSGYSVTVQTQPAGQICSVASGSGTMGNADITSVIVTCGSDSFTLGGNISGLSTAGLVLANGSDTLAVSANATSFTLPTAVSFGSAYSVTVQTQPTGLTCSVASGSGTMGAANVNNVAVTCSANSFTLGGSVSGLSTAGLVLANGSDTLTVSANATGFTLPTAVAFGGGYAVTVQTQPTGLTCSVANGSGTMGAANVSNVAVTCSANSFTLGGSLSGLTGSGLVLANGSDTLTVSANATSFTMPAAVAFGSAYNVTVQTQPTGFSCTVSNGGGTMGAANVSNVAVTCSANSFTLGGSISGLTSGGLVLANGSDTLSVAANATSFTLPTAVAFGSSYTVTVKTQTDDRTCAVTNGSGTMGLANISNVNVSCVPASFSLVSTLAGSGTAGSADGSGTAAGFNGPAGVIADASGNLYVADSGNNIIRKITPDGTVSTFAGSVAGGSKDGTGTAALLKAPTGMTFDASGNLIVADRFNNQIRKITAGGVVTTIVSSSAGSFNQPTGVAVDAGGNLYVADSNHNVIDKFAPDGTRTVLAGTFNVAGSADGAGASATFSQPFGITIDASGNLFVADRSNNKIRKITPDGTVSTVAGTGVSGNTDGAGTTAKFNLPIGIAVGASGYLYVTDQGNNKIRLIAPDGNVSTLAGSGTSGSTDGATATATFSGPFGIGIDGGGNVYVADTGSNKIRKIARD